MIKRPPPAPPPPPPPCTAHDKKMHSLYDKNNLIVDKMLENGLLDEARAMQGKCQKTCAQAIGHKELARYLNGEASLEECAQKLKQESRRYAKRQITWFKRRQCAVFISID